MARFSLTRWWRQHRPGPWRVGLTVDEADQLPLAIAHGVAILVGLRGAPKWVAFECPCGKGHRIMLNLARSRHPYWSIETAVPLTIWPSVDVTVDSDRCHFVVEYGHINWVRGLDLYTSHR